MLRYKRISNIALGCSFTENLLCCLRVHLWCKNRIIIQESKKSIISLSSEAATYDINKKKQILHTLKSQYNQIREELAGFVPLTPSTIPLSSKRKYVKIVKSRGLDIQIFMWAQLGAFSSSLYFNNGKPYSIADHVTILSFDLYLDIWPIQAWANVLSGFPYSRLDTPCSTWISQE